MTNLVLIAHNRHRLLEQSLSTLYKYTPRDQFNLTLIDDGSTDFRARRLLELTGMNANATYLRIEKSAHVIARAKNLGVFWSRQTFGCGDWLYLSDSDVAFTEGWLEKLTLTATVTEHDQYRLWGGQAHPFHLQIHGHNSIEFKNIAWTEHAVLDGPSWLMRWKTWRDVGQFSPKCAAGACQSEDAEWCARLTAKGGRIGVIQPHVVVHTGLTQSDGKMAPGADVRAQQIPAGVLAE